MRNPIRSLILLAVAAAVLAAGQDGPPPASLEEEIRALEQASRDAVLRGDIPALDKIWADDLTVNAPNGRVVRGKQEVFARIREGIIKYSSFTAEVEAVKIVGEVAIVMGLEIVQPVGSAPLAGQTVRRRYTNIWMMRDGKWLLTARHANVICQP